MTHLNKYKFIENMLSDETDNEIFLRSCHLKYAMGSFRFRNDKGVYYWHNDDERITTPKKINVIWKPSKIS